MRNATERRAVVIGLLLAAVAPLAGVAAEEGEWIDLFNGRDMSGWIAAKKDGPNGWRVVDGIYDNRTPSTNIYTEKWFQDFDAHVEFAMYPRSNAGLYLLGRYEVQMLDSYGKEKVGASDCGALYKEVAPKSNQSKPPHEWQTFDISLRAAQFDAEGNKTENMRITIVHNGVKIHDNVELDEPTGSGKRFDEEQMGPILIQGDHGSIKFRKFRVRGRVYDPPAPDAPGPAVVGLKSEPTKVSPNNAPGLALQWRTRNHGYAPSYRVYRGTSPGFPHDEAHVRDTTIKREFKDCDFESDGTYYYRIVGLGAGGKAGPASAVISVKGKANQVETAALADATWARNKSYGAPKRNRSYSRKPMSMHGKKSAKGIGVRGDSTIRFYVGKMVGNASDYRFRTTVGLDDSMRDSYRKVAAAQFVVKLDDKVVFDSGEMTWNDGTRDVDLPVPAGTRKLELIVNRKGESGADYDNWANPRLERASR